jgi:hypothetical protein
VDEDWKGKFKACLDALKTDGALILEESNNKGDDYLLYNPHVW